MEKIALFPFNKITQGIVRFNDMIQFKICSVIDFVLHHGGDAGEIIDGRKRDIIITQNIKQGLLEADTLILNDPGTAFGNNTSIYNDIDFATLWRDLVKEAHQRNIMIISVHEIYDTDTLLWLKEQGINIFIPPQISKEVDHLLNTFYSLAGNDEIARYLKYFEVDDKLLNKQSNIKRVGIFASRGCLGKFTAQIGLLRALNKAGRKTSAIITEPTAFLFGQPGADIMKFLSRYPLSQYPYYIDALVQEAEQNANEYILFAGQGSLLPNQNFIIASTKISYLRTFHPDYTLLVTDYNDNETLRDSIEILKVYGNKRLPTAILLPDKIEMDYGNYLQYSNKEFDKRKQEIKDLYGIDCVESVINIEAIMDLLL